MTFLPDSDRGCGECGGEGVTRTATDRGTTLVEGCWRCGGSGANSIAIRKSPATVEGEQKAKTQ